MNFDYSNKTYRTDTNYDINQDDDFKELLVRKVARAVKKKKPIKLFLEKLQSNLGKHCKKLWTQMVMTTTDKLKNLLLTNDLLQESDITMQLSATEWLLYDLVLVHEKINVADNEDTPECLNELFRLIQLHDVENLIGDELAMAWIRLILRYNKGGRKVSPMLLQQRWYQLKEMARKKVFEQVKGYSEEKIKLLYSISIKYQKIITQPYPTWQSLIKQKRVILPEQFVEILNEGEKWIFEADELWYLELNQEDHDSFTSKIDKNNKNLVHPGIPITINSGTKIDKELFKKIKDPLRIDLPKDQHDNYSIKQLISEKMEQYLVDKPKLIDLPKGSGDKDPVKSKEKDQYFVNKPKLADLLKDHRDYNPVKLVKSKEKDQYFVHKPKLADLLKDQCDNNPLKQVISKEKEQYLGDISKPMSKSKDIPSLLDTDDEVDNLSKEISEIINGLSENLSGNTADDTADKMNKDTTIGEESTREVTKRGIVKRKKYLVVEKTDFSNKDVELIDLNKKKRQKKQFNTARLRYDNDGNMRKYIDNDSKLRMKTIVSTKKLDSMNVFKHGVYDAVKDKKMIECALLESKPILEHVSRKKHDDFAQDITSLGSKIHIEDDLIQNANETAYKSLMSTSWLFRKPKRRRYYIKQLQKNPDFNMAIKKLTPEFISSTSNKNLLEKCIPLTIDVHKDFENQLVNGRITIKNAKKFKSINPTVTKKVYNVGTESQIYKVSGTNISKQVVTNKHDPQEVIEQVSQRTRPTVCESNKIINLPDVDQIREINETLLADNITPILNESQNKQSEVNHSAVVQSTEETSSLQVQEQNDQLNDLEYIKNILHEESSITLHENTSD